MRFAGGFLLALAQLVLTLLSLYTWVIIASAIFSWLYAFNIINSSNQFVNQIGEIAADSATRTPMAVG